MPKDACRRQWVWATTYCVPQPKRLQGAKDRQRAEPLATLSTAEQKRQFCKHVWIQAIGSMPLDGGSHLARVPCHYRPDLASESKFFFFVDDAMTFKPPPPTRALALELRLGE